MKLDEQISAAVKGERRAFLRKLKTVEQKWRNSSFSHVVEDLQKWVKARSK
jgi:hypothetical protein